MARKVNPFTMNLLPARVTRFWNILYVSYIYIWMWIVEIRGIESILFEARGEPEQRGQSQVEYNENN